MYNKVFVIATILLCVMLLQPGALNAQKRTASKMKVLLDTDANNELDDQHAMAYLFFNGNVFDVVGVTVNATYNGGNIDKQYEEAKRVMQLCGVWGRTPLLKGADKSFENIRANVKQKRFDGSEAVNFMIEQARKAGKNKLVLLPVGKLTNIALALQKEPSIATKVRIVWLGSNYPEPGEYNQDNDTASLNFILNRQVPFEVVTVRYGKPSGTSAVTATRKEINQQMPGAGPTIKGPVEGRHGGTFTNFGDYSANLYEHIEAYDEVGTRALYDMAAVAIVKNPTWAEKKSIPAPVLVANKWKEQPGNKRQIIIWENFNKQAIMGDFYRSMKNYVLIKPQKKSLAFQ